MKRIRLSVPLRLLPIKIQCFSRDGWVAVP
jgi:hypothetical protein